MENFLNELKDNEVLRDDFLAQNSMNDAYEVAKPYLDEGFSEDDFSAEMIGLAKEIVEKDGLSDEMLESVQGGVSGENNMSEISAIVVEDLLKNI